MDQQISITSKGNIGVNKQMMQQTIKYIQIKE